MPNCSLPFICIWKYFRTALPVFFILSCFLISVKAETGNEDKLLKEKNGLLSLSGKISKHAFTIYIDAKVGEDISDKLQTAFDTVRAQGGGTVVAPPGEYVISKEIAVSGSFKRFPTGKGKGITFDGNGATFWWDGPDNGAVLDLPAPDNCTLKNFILYGRRGKTWRNVIGVRYRGGVERKMNGGKNNRFENIRVQNLGVGFQIGSLFGPDLVGGTFVGTKAWGVRIGYHILGANVTNMVFISPIVQSFEEAGFLVSGFTARHIRRDKNDAVPKPEIPGMKTVLYDEITGREIFRNELPKWMTEPGVKYPVKTFKYNGVGPTLWATGGAPDITIYSLLAHSSHAESWVLDTDIGNIRVYGARIEGMAGIFRKRNSLGKWDSRFSDVLVNVSATSTGGINQNAIEYNGKGPLYLFGGVFYSNIALGQNTRAYVIGTRFLRHRQATKIALMSQDYKKKLPPCITDTGKLRIVVLLRGKARVVKVKTLSDPGFVQLSGTDSAQIYQLGQSICKDLRVPIGTRQLKVELPPMERQPDGNYQVIVTPGFDAGNFWVSGREGRGFTINFAKAAPRGARVNVLIERAPFKGY
jgi:hypothetical protein